MQMMKALVFSVMAVLMFSTSGLNNPFSSLLIFALVSLAPK